MTGRDFYHITEMITKNIELEMSEDTYDCILNSVFGMKPGRRISIINGQSINFNNSLPLGTVTIHAKYIPAAQQKTTIQITC